MVKQVRYDLDFAPKGAVALNIRREDTTKNERLVFECLEDMEACALVRPHIPMAVWDGLEEMYKSAQAQYNPKHL